MEVKLLLKCLDILSCRSIFASSIIHHNNNNCKYMESLLSEVNEVLKEINHRLTLNKPYQTIEGVNFDIKGLKEYEDILCEMVDDDAEVEAILTELWATQNSLQAEKKRKEFWVSYNKEPYNRGVKVDQSHEAAAIMALNSDRRFSITE